MTHPNLTLESLRTGHYPMHEMPPRFATLVERFVLAHEPASTPA